HLRIETDSGLFEQTVQKAQRVGCGFQLEFRRRIRGRSLEISNRCMIDGKVIFIHLCEENRHPEGAEQKTTSKQPQKSIVHLINNLQSKLTLAWIQRRADGAELHVVGLRIRVSPVQMIERIKNLCSHLDLYGLARLEAPDNRD